MTLLIRRDAATLYWTRFGMSVMELHVLSAIYRRPCTSQKELLKEFWFERTATSRTISSLVKRAHDAKNFGRRCACHRDETDAQGCTIIRNENEISQSPAKEFLLGSLTPTEIDAFDRYTHRLVQHARERFGKS